MVDEVDGANGAARRPLILRRRGMGGGFSGGTSTRSESLRAPEEPDEVDDAIDPEQATDRIRTGQMPPPEPERDNPRMRLNQVAMAGSTAYAKEFRLELLGRLLMRNIPLDQIAGELRVSISTVEKDRAELGKRRREAARALNIDEMIGETNAFYDEVKGMALRIATGGTGENGAGTPTAMRLAAMRTGLAAVADKVRFHNTAGVFDALRFRRSEDGTSVSDVQTLMQRTMELMETLNEGDSPPQPKQPKPGQFRPMSFDDSDASGSSSEIQEI